MASLLFRPVAGLTLGRCPLRSHGCISTALPLSASAVSRTPFPPASFAPQSYRCQSNRSGRKKKSVSELRIRGIDILRDPKLNKGMAFTLRERQLLGVHGLLPPHVINQEQQLNRSMRNFLNNKTDLDKYINLIALQDRNEKLFYRLVSENVEMMAPIIYTPTVGQACQNFGLIFRKPRGLYITIDDIGHVYNILCNWPQRSVSAIVVTDGERILGLGDLGAYGMGIPVGKLSLYTAMAGVKPQRCLPIVLDVGTDNEKLLNDPMYIGLKHKRVRGEQYDGLIDEFLEAVVRRWGQETLVQFEDFANHNAFRLLEKYRNKYCTFNDDIQGTASVALAGIIASMRITGNKLSENKYLFQGAGEASIGIATLLVMAMQEEGLSEEEAIDKIWMVDSRGLLTKDRPSGGVTGHKLTFAKDHPHTKNLADVVKDIKPNAIIGAAAVAGAFTEEIIRDMAAFNERPIIFALSNPTSMSECTAEQAYTLTEGRCVFASGSPFDPVTLNGQTFYPGQGNNAYIFPGVALAVVLSKSHHVPDSYFLKAAQALANMVTDDHLAQGRVYPPLSDILEVSTKIATKIVEYSYLIGQASHYPEPVSKEAFVRSEQYSTEYESFIPPTWDWPGYVEDN